MVHTDEGWFSAKDGTKLYTKTWKPETTPIAVVVFLHGFSDHCNAYYDFFPTLATKCSLQISTLDQRGWGRSVLIPSDKGLTGTTTQVLTDINDFTASIAQSHPDIPLFLMGHSMGGAQALIYALTTAPFTPPRPQITGLLVEAPFIALDPSAQPYRLTVSLGKLAAKFLPSRQMLQKLDPKYVSRSPKVQQEWNDDELCHDTGTLGGMAGMLQRAADLVSLSEHRAIPGLSTHLNFPVWFGHGDGDKVTSYPASKKFFDELQVEGGDKTFKAYPGAYHKLHAEPDGVGEEFAKDVGEWIVRHVKSSAGNSKRDSGVSGQPKL